MAYSTGAGTYTDLMAAILAHAVADGWTTTGGTWPISKGNIRGVNWSTTTRAVTDYTSGVAVALTERIIRLAVGTSPSDATTKAGADATSAIVCCMNFAIADWHIFSDSGAGKPNYIHVVCRFSNGFDAEVYNHFSFGELDKGGMTYGSVAYAASHARRAYVALPASSSTEGSQSYDYNCGQNNNWSAHFSGGSKGLRAQNYNRQETVVVNNLVFIISPTNTPVPTSGGWVQSDTVGTYSDLLDCVCPSYALEGNAPTALTDGVEVGMCAIPGLIGAQPYSGGVSFAPLPFILMSGSGASSPAMFLGVFPGVRLCSMQSFLGRDEVTYGSEVWKLMPLLKKTSFAQMQVGTIVSSGEMGYAYKKVA